MPRAADREALRVERLARHPYDVVEEARQHVAAVTPDGAPDPPADHGLQEVGRRDLGLITARVALRLCGVTAAATNDAALGGAAPDLQPVDRLEEVASIRRAVDGHGAIRCSDD